MQRPATMSVVTVPRAASASDGYSQFEMDYGDKPVPQPHWPTRMSDEELAERIKREHKIELARLNAELERVEDEYKKNYYYGVYSGYGVYAHEQKKYDEETKRLARKFRDLRERYGKEPAKTKEEIASAMKKQYEKERKMIEDELAHAEGQYENDWNTGAFHGIGISGHDETKYQDAKARLNEALDMLNMKYNM